MTTPAQKRARAEELREVARTISTKAWQLDDDLDTLLERYPHRSDGVWWGPSATDFYEGVRQVRTDARTLRQDVLDYAARCRTRATELDEEADVQEAELAEEDGQG